VPQSAHSTKVTTVAPLGAESVALRVDAAMGARPPGCPEERCADLAPPAPGGEITKGRPMLVAPRQRNSQTRAAASAVAAFLSIADVAARWSCGRSFVYEAIAEMERNGYLRRLVLGRVQRIAVESILQYEVLHAGAEVDRSASVIAGLRAARATRKGAERTQTVAPSKGLRAKWREHVASTGTH